MSPNNQFFMIKNNISDILSINVNYLNKTPLNYSLELIELLNFLLKLHNSKLSFKTSKSNGFYPNTKNNSLKNMKSKTPWSLIKNLWITFLLCTLFILHIFLFKKSSKKFVNSIIKVSKLFSLKCKDLIITSPIPGLIKN
jgi:hypothetical protein